MKIHSLSAVSPSANIGQNVEIGPFCVVEPDAVIGDRCKLESGSVIKAGTILGEANHVFEGAVLGGMPQHVEMPETPGKTIIGCGNTIRENVTIHRAMCADEVTTIGNNNLLMANAHVAHDCRVGNHLILANNVMVAGHVTLGDRAYLSGGVAVHQFCRIGMLAMVGGQSHITKDVPPYVTIDGLSSQTVGLNQIGLRRAGHPVKDVRQLKAAYRTIYRSGFTWNEILEHLEAEFNEGPAALMYQFLTTTTRGIIQERRLPPGATLKIRRDTVPQKDLQSRAG